MATSFASSGLFLMLALTPACSSEDSGPSGTGGTNTAGTTNIAGTNTGGTNGGSGGTGGSPTDPAGPLLNRPSGGRYDCSVARPVARFTVPWAGFSLVSGAEESLLAVVESDRNNPDPNRPGNRITWSTLAVDGTLGSRTVLRPETREYLASVTATHDGEKATIVWTEASGNGAKYSVHSMQVDDAGMVVEPASVLFELPMQSQPKIARAGSGYALSWVERGAASAKLGFGRLDGRGKLSGTPSVLAQSRGLAEGDIASVGDNFVVSYLDYEHFDSGRVGRLLVLGPDGTALGEPIVFEDSGATGFAPTVPRLLVRGEQVLAAWSVVTGDNSSEVQEAATTIRLARFDANGARLGPLFDLQAPVMDQESVQPFWVERGDDVGLLWAEGSIIYICGGCVPDHSLKFVMLDGQTFNPQSEVVELANTLPSGGLLSPEAARDGDDLLVVSTVTYHTSGEGASGALRCTE